MRKIALVIVAAAALAGIVLFAADKPPGRTNVLVLLLDTTRADHLSVYGYERDTTPNLVRLAADGLVADYAITAAPWTPPAVASILSGLYVPSHGLMPTLARNEAHSTSRLNDGVVTLGQMLTAHGYATAGISSNPWISEEFGFTRGFETFGYAPGANAGKITTQAIAQITELGAKEKPFFLYVHYLDPHAPYSPPREYRRRYSGPLACCAYYSSKLHGPLALYDGEIRYLDHELGRLFDALESAELYDRTLVVVVGDHGEQFKEHGNLRHGLQLFDEEVRVPLLIKPPDGGPRGVRVRETASIVDIVPTVLGQLGLPVPPGLPGVSLFDKAALTSRAGVLSHISRYYSQASFIDRDGKKLLIGSRVRKEMVDVSDPTRNVIGVFDGPTDPLARQPLTDDALLAELQAGFRETMAKALAARVDAADREVTVSDDTLERLRSLGYVK